jgi:hypothetical protein
MKGSGRLVLPLPILFAPVRKRRRCESCDLHEIATACEIFPGDAHLPLSAMDRPGALR